MLHENNNYNLIPMCIGTRHINIFQMLDAKLTNISLLISRLFLSKHYSFNLMS